MKLLRLNRTSTVGGVGIDSVAAAASQQTQGQRLILELIGLWRSVAEVATLLGRSATTIDVYRNKLRIKLGLRYNQQQLRSRPRGCSSIAWVGAIPADAAAGERP